ncbi:unnamed protein product, partial [Medioppia subpectinata]
MATSKHRIKLSSDGDVITESNMKHRLHHLFGQIEKEFDGLITENVARIHTFHTFPDFCRFFAFHY